MEAIKSQEKLVAAKSIEKLAAVKHDKAAKGHEKGVKVCVFYSCLFDLFSLVHTTLCNPKSNNVKSPIAPKPTSSVTSPVRVLSNHEIAPPISTQLDLQLELIRLKRELEKAKMENDALKGMSFGMFYLCHVVLVRFGMVLV